MIVHAYFLCYNEEYILPHLLKYYSSFCEKIVVIDNMSTDNSVAIAKSFKNVDVISFNSNNQFNDGIHVHIKNMIWKDSCADYVIVADADEFLYADDMIKFLEARKIEDVDIMTPKGYFMVGDASLHLKSDDDLLSLVREGIRGECNDKPIIFNPKTIKDINFSYGGHMANPIKKDTTKVNWYKSDGDLKLLHYKYLGLKEFIPKHLSRGPRLSKLNRDLNMGTYYLYDEETHTKEYNSFVNKRVKVI